MPQIDTEKTVVVFRKWRDGGILALFPLEMNRANSALCLSFEHVGQHGSADYGYCISVTQPATPEEYADTKRELETGYSYNLEIRKRKPTRKD